MIPYSLKHRIRQNPPKKAVYCGFLLLFLDGKTTARQIFGNLLGNFRHSPHSLYFTWHSKFHFVFFSNLKLTSFQPNKWVGINQLLAFNGLPCTTPYKNKREKWWIKNHRLWRLVLFVFLHRRIKFFRARKLPWNEKAQIIIKACMILYIYILLQ